MFDDADDKDIGIAEERTIFQILCDQIEFANVILLNKSDLLSEEENRDIKYIIKQFNKGAEIIETVHAKLDLSKVLNTSKFIFEEAEANIKWLGNTNSSTENVEKFDCPKGHNLNLRNKKPDHYPSIFCDSCSKDIKSYGQKFYHCSKCNFDICVNCAVNFKRTSEDAKIEAESEVECSVINFEYRK